MALLDLLFPTDCAGCGASGALACAACRSALAGTAGLAWPSPSPAGLPPPWAVTAYGGVCRELLIAYKERDAIGLRPVLAVPLAEALRAAAVAAQPGRRGIVIVPVPSTRRANRERGDDVVLGLARTAAAIGRRRGLRLRVVPVLRHVRAVADSAGLDAVARSANLAAAFGVPVRLRNRIDGATVVVADDLITTGASVAEAARALRACGAVVVGAATVAATRRHADAALTAVDGTALRSGNSTARGNSRDARSGAPWTSS